MTKPVCVIGISKTKESEHLLLNYIFHTIHFRGIRSHGEHLLMTPFSHGEGWQNGSATNDGYIHIRRYPFTPLSWHGCDTYI